MDDQRVGAVFRAVRLRRRLRQADVAGAAGLSHTTVSRLERGHLDTLSLRSVRAIGAVLEIRVDLAPWSRRGDLIRFATAEHAALVESVVRELAQVGWDARAEASFSEFGERGFVDVLGWHAASGTLLVVEAKTAVVDVGETIGILDRKRRLAPRIAARLGWNPRAVSSALIVSDSRTNRRRIASHGATFRTLLPADGRTLRAHLRRPHEAIQAVAFWSPAHGGHVRQDRLGHRRVRRLRSGARPQGASVA